MNNSPDLYHQVVGLAKAVDKNFIELGKTLRELQDTDPEKFRLALPPIDQAQIRGRLTNILPILAECGVGVDVNTAGLRKSTCGIPYVPEWFMDACAERGIELVYGSDAHHPDDVGAGWEWFAAAAKRK